MKKTTVHIVPEFKGQAPPQSSTTLCYKMIGSTDGFITVRDALIPMHTRDHRDKLYHVSFTRKGLKSLDEDTHVSKYGEYYESHQEDTMFCICKHCLDSSEFGMLALKEL